MLGRLALPLIFIAFLGYSVGLPFLASRLLPSLEYTSLAVVFVVVAIEVPAVLWLRWALDGFVDTDLWGQTPEQQRKFEQASLDALQAASAATAPVRKLHFDLDTAPSHRWDEVVKHFCVAGEAEKMKEMLVGQLMTEYGKVGAIIISFVLKIVMIAHARFCMPAHFREELLGMARITASHRLSYFDLLQINYGGDFLANCTSAVVALAAPVHLRNMDWFPQERLRPLTVQFEVHRGGQHLYSSTGWCFFVGTHTAMRRGGVRTDAFSISMNFRSLDKGLVGNFLRFLGPAWPQAWLIREIMETETGYRSAQRALETAYLIAPCFLTIAGSMQGQGCIMERNGGHTSSLTRHVDSSPANGHKLAVTNCDVNDPYIKLSRCHDDPLLLNALHRRKRGESLIDTHFNTAVIGDGRQLSKEQILELGTNVLSASPVNNYQTVFGVVMVPGLDIYESRLWPVSDDSRSLDKRLGGRYTDADLQRLGVRKAA